MTTTPDFRVNYTGRRAGYFQLVLPHNFLSLRLLFKIHHFGKLYTNTEIFKDDFAVHVSEISGTLERLISKRLNQNSRQPQ